MINNIIKKYNTFSVQVKSVFWFTICSFLQRAINVITTPIYTRLLSTSEYGQYGVFNSWLSIISIFVTLNLTAGVNVQGLVKFEDNKYKFSSSLQGLSLVLTLIWTIVYLLFKDSINQLLHLTTIQMLLMLIIMWSSSSINFWSNEERTVYKYKSLIIVSILMSILQPILAIYFIKHSNDKVTAKILGIALIQVIFGLLFFTIQIKKGKKLFSKQYWLYALKFNIPLIPHYLSQTILNSADRIMIERYAGFDKAGLYNLGYSISFIMIIFNSSFLSTLSPWIYQKIKERKEDETKNIVYFSLIIIALLNIMLIAFAPEIVKIFAPNDYYESIYIIPPVAMSVYFIFSYDLFAKYEFYYEKTSLITAATIIAALMNLITNFIFIKLFGYIAAGYTTLFCYILYALFHYLMMIKVCKECMNRDNVYNTKIILMITFVFVLLGFLLLLGYRFIIIRYSIIVVLLIIVFINKSKIIDYIKFILKRY